MTQAQMGIIAVQSDLAAKAKAYGKGFISRTIQESVKATLSGLDELVAEHEATSAAALKAQAEQFRADLETRRIKNRIKRFFKR